MRAASLLRLQSCVSAFSRGPLGPLSHQLPPCRSALTTRSAARKRPQAARLPEQPAAYSREQRLEHQRASGSGQSGVPGLRSDTNRRPSNRQAPSTYSTISRTRAPVAPVRTAMPAADPTPAATPASAAALRSKTLSRLVVSFKCWPVLGFRAQPRCSVDASATITLRRCHTLPTASTSRAPAHRRIPYSSERFSRPHFSATSIVARRPDRTADQPAT